MYSKLTILCALICYFIFACQSHYQSWSKLEKREAYQELLRLDQAYCPQALMATALINQAWAGKFLLSTLAQKHFIDPHYRDRLKAQHTNTGFVSIAQSLRIDQFQLEQVVFHHELQQLSQQEQALLSKIQPVLIGVLSIPALLSQGIQMEIRLDEGTVIFYPRSTELNLPMNHIFLGDQIDHIPARWHWSEIPRENQEKWKALFQEIQTEAQKNQLSTLTPNPNADQLSTLTPNPNADQLATLTPNPNADQPSTLTPNPNADQPSTLTPNPNADQPSSDQKRAQAQASISAQAPKRFLSPQQELDALLTPVELSEPEELRIDSTHALNTWSQQRSEAHGQIPLIASLAFTAQKKDFYLGKAKEIGVYRQTFKQGLAGLQYFWEGRLYFTNNGIYYVHTHDKNDQEYRLRRVNRFMPFFKCSMDCFQGNTAQQIDQEHLLLYFQSLMPQLPTGLWLKYDLNPKGMPMTVLISYQKTEKKALHYQLKLKEAEALIELNSKENSNSYQINLVDIVRLNASCESELCLIVE